MQTLYEILGVAPDADPTVIKQAYRRLARELHPDATGNDAARSARFREVADAYRVLSNNDLRNAYDEKLRREPRRIDLAATKGIVERLGGDIIDHVAAVSRKKAGAAAGRAVPLGERGNRILDELAQFGGEAAKARLSEFLKKL